MKYFRNNRMSRKISLNEEVERPQGDIAALDFYNTIRDYFGLKMTSAPVNLTPVDIETICDLKRRTIDKERLANFPGFYCWVCYSKRLDKGSFAFDLDPNSRDIIMYSFDEPSTPIRIIKTDAELERFLDINKIDKLYGLTTNLADEKRFDNILNGVERDQ